MSNEIRYRQFIPDSYPFSGFKKAHWRPWGMIDGRFIEPMMSNGTYPESFQSTGFHDSKGVEIWEGSILEWPGGERGAVCWGKELGGWKVRAKKWFLSESTVIGDTTTTPELLEVVK